MDPIKDAFRWATRGKVLVDCPRDVEALMWLARLESSWEIGDPAGETGFLEWSVASMPPQLWNQMRWADKAGGEWLDSSFIGKESLASLCLRGRLR